MDAPIESPQRPPGGKEEARRPRLRLTLGAAIVLVVLGLSVAVLVAALAPHGSTQTVIAGTGAPAGSSAGPRAGGPAEPSASAFPGGAVGERTALFVHILGEVKSPGIYELHSGDRVIDAVAAARGLTGRADQAQLNLARFLSDGEQIIVPREGQVVATGAPGAAAGPGSAAKVNINTADAAALESLPGVGPALAQRILDWRSANGNFASVDDLLNVTGIGQKTLDGFREAVTT